MLNYLCCRDQKGLMEEMGWKEHSGIRYMLQSLIILILHLNFTIMFRVKKETKEKKEQQEKLEKKVWKEREGRKGLLVQKGKK